MMNSLCNKISEDQKIHVVFCNCFSKNKFMKKDPVVKSKSVKNLKSVNNLSPFLNINCLMNVNIKQSQRIWETNFGKRLIYGNDSKQNQGFLELGELLQKATQEDTNDLMEMKSDELEEKKNLFFLKKNSALSKNGREKTRGKVSSRNMMALEKSSLKSAKSKMRERKKKNGMENQMNNCDSSEKPSTVPSTFTTTQNMTLTTDKENMESSYETLRVPSLVKNKGLLTNYVKNILDNVSNENICEHCERTFSRVHELIDHRKAHEVEKENCLLCDKVFYRTEDFIQHLLTHEGVDRFSCKMCKKYFPTLKTYKNHYKECHLIPLKTLSQNGEEMRSQWRPTYECLRCKAVFGSRETLKNHKRSHQKMDLTGAYLLCPKDL